MSREPIVITGVGVLSAIGLGYRTFAESVASGVTGLAPYSGAPELLAGEVVGFQIADYLVAEKTYLDRCSEFALAAVKLCLDDAGLTVPPADEGAAGLVLGTQYGCAATMASYTARVRQRGLRFATPLLFTHAFVNTPASLVAIDYRLKGYHATVTSGATSGTQALVTAALALQAGHADAILAGAVDALTPEIVAARRAECFGSDDPDAFDPWASDGTVLGEGAAIFLLERLADALARGARPRAVVALETGAADLTIAALPGAADGPAVAPEGLYGRPLGAAGALATAVGLVALEQSVAPPVARDGGDLDARREPRPLADVATVAVADHGITLRLRRAQA